MRTDATYRVLEKLRAQRRSGLPWDRIGALWGVSGGTAQRMAKGVEPRDPATRMAFGLPPVKVAGVQMVDARRCSHCRRPFIPNVPSRRLCFECRPVRRKP